MLLEVKDIQVYYGAIHAVKDVSFEVNDGEIVFTSRWFPKEAQRTVLLKGQGDCRLWQLQKESFIQL